VSARLGDLSYDNLIGPSCKKLAARSKVAGFGGGIQPLGSIGLNFLWWPCPCHWTTCTTQKVPAVDFRLVLRDLKMQRDWAGQGMLQQERMRGIRKYNDLPRVVKASNY
jgi:hypothetical protein